MENLKITLSKHAQMRLSRVHDITEQEIQEDVKNELIESRLFISADCRFLYVRGSHAKYILSPDLDVITIMRKDSREEDAHYRNANFAYVPRQYVENFVRGFRKGRGFMNVTKMREKVFLDLDCEDILGSKIRIENGKMFLKSGTH